MNSSPSSVAPPPTPAALSGPSGPSGPSQPPPRRQPEPTVAGIDRTTSLEPDSGSFISAFFSCCCSPFGEDEDFRSQRRNYPYDQSQNGNRVGSPNGSGRNSAPAPASVDLPFANKPIPPLQFDIRKSLDRPYGSPYVSRVNSQAVSPAVSSTSLNLDLEKFNLDETNPAIVTSTPRIGSHEDDPSNNNNKKQNNNQFLNVQTNSQTPSRQSSSTKLAAKGSGSSHDDNNNEPLHTEEMTYRYLSNLITQGDAYMMPLLPEQRQFPHQTALLPSLEPNNALYGRKCLVLDLDETLVHSSFQYIHDADFVIPVEIDNQFLNVYVIKRPGVDEFMARVGEMYEIVVFTASVSKYGDPLLDQLDPTGTTVHHRLFRESCFNYQGAYIKNLAQLGRPLSDCIIIDNSPASYIFHPHHAVPVSSWFSDAHDNELLDMLPILEDLAGQTVSDVALVLDVNIS